MNSDNAVNNQKESYSIMNMLDSENYSDVILAIEMIDNYIEQDNDLFILQLQPELNSYNSSRFPLRSFFVCIIDIQARVNDYCRFI